MNLPILSNLKSGCCLLIALALSAGSALAGRYPTVGTQTFDGGPTTNLGDGTQIASNNTGRDGNPAAVVVNGLLRLTQARVTNTNSSFKLPDLDPGLAVTSWDVVTQVRMDRFSSFSTPADGWALNIGPIPEGSGTGEGGFVMANGLVIAFDTFNNGNDPPSIEIFANGISVGNFPQSFTFDTTLRSLAVHWDSAGLDVTYTAGSTSNVICANLATPGYQPAAGHRFAFSARTGGNSEGVYLDNLLVTTVAGLPLETGGPVISEFAADNVDVLEDENGDSSDWIEIYNGKSTATNLAGWSLSEVPGAPGTWVFPSVSIPAYGYLTVFASSKNRNTAGYPLHTDFSLSKVAGYLALCNPAGTAVSEFNYGPQAEDVTYGLLENAGTYNYGYLETPTPSGRNTGLQAAGPPAEDVVFLKDGVPTSGGLFSSSFNLAIQTPLEPDSVVRYTLDNTPPGATSAIYTTPISVTATRTIRARIFTPNRLPGPISSRTFVQLDASLTNYHASNQPFSSNLPIIVLDSFGVPVDSYTDSSQLRPYRLTYAVVIDQNPLAVGADANRASITGPADFQGRCGTHVRGESSTGFPQKSYSWELWNNDNEDKDAALLGFPAESDWVLHAPYTDKTMMRNYLTYSQMRAINGKSAAMGVKFVEVFFNQDGGTLGESDYRGVYVLVEKIKRNGERVDIEKLNDIMTDPAVISGGYIFKKDKAGIGNVSFTTATNSQTFQFVEPENPNAAQKAWLTGFMNNFEAALNSANFADPVTGYAAYINPLSFVDNQWFVEITKQIDGYRLSTYFHKDRNGKLSCSPVWDYNLSLFNADYNTGDVHTGWYRDVLGTADYYYWPRLLQDPNYKILHWDRYWELRRSVFNSDTILSGIDALAGTLTNGNLTPVTNSMANLAPLAENPAMRQFRKWPILSTYVWPNPANYANRSRYWTGPTVNPPAYTAATGEVDAMKGFLKQRLAWIDDQNFVGSIIYRPPVLSRSGGTVEMGTTLAIARHSGTAPAGYSYATGGTLYYTTDDSDPRSSTGTPVGIPYGEPIVLNRSATVKARLYANSTWSPLATADFIVDAAPASPANLVISEFCYRPTSPAPGTPEYLAGFISGNNFEYVELLNVSNGNVDLTNCQVSGGITFSFAGLTQAQLTLAPGARVLLVGNEAAFAMRYGSDLADRVLGTFSGNLSNSGETFSLLAANGGVIAQVTYGIVEPWPTAAQNAGYSLVLGLSGPNPTYDASNFRASLQPGGTPGEAAGFPATISLDGFERVATGAPIQATATTDPTGLGVSITYNGSSAPPSEPGSYSVIATVTHPDYLGSSAGTLFVYGHAVPVLGNTTLELPTVHVGYPAAVTSAPVAVGNEAGVRLNLAGSAPLSGLITLNGTSAITPGQTVNLAASLSPGRGVGKIDDAIPYVFKDDSALEGASNMVGTTNFRVLGQVYSGDMIWAGVDGSWSDAASWNDQSPDGTGVHAAPGLESGFTGIDSATFAGDGVTITLDGVAPNLNRLTFLSGGNTLASGTGATGLTLAGSNPVVACQGANTLSAPVTLASDLLVVTAGNSSMLTLSGAVASEGADKRLTLNGDGTLQVSGTLGAAVTVAGSTLTGAGQIAGEVVVDPTGSINPGAVGEVGVLSVGSANLAGTWVCDINATDSDRLAVTGALALNEVTLSFQASNTPTAASYVLASCLGNAPSFKTITNMPVGYHLDYSQVGTIRLLKYSDFENYLIDAGVPENQRGPTDDPDGDGQGNLLEFALGGHPANVADQAKAYPLIADSDDADTEDELLLTIAVRIGTPAFAGAPTPSATHEGITYTIEGGRSLEDFSAAVISVTPAVSNLPTPPSGYEYRTFSLDRISASQGFLRVRVSGAP